MTASLCQSGSSDATSAETGRMPWFAEASMSFIRASPEIVEIQLVAHAAAQAKHVRRNPVRIELSEVARPRPLVTGASDQVLHLVLRASLDPKRGGVDLDPARMCVVRVKVHHAHDHVFQVFGGLGVGEEL